MVDGWCMYSRGNLEIMYLLVEYRIVSMLPWIDGWMTIIDAIVLLMVDELWLVMMIWYTIDAYEIMYQLCLPITY